MDFHQIWYVCALILKRSGLGLLMGKFNRFLTDLSVCNTIVARYYCFKFLSGAMILKSFICTSAP